MWRLAVLLLILEHCRQKIATVEQLHVMNWAVKSKRAQSQFLDFIRGHKAPNQVIVRYDPGLTRAIGFALGEGIVRSNEMLVSGKGSTSDFRIELTELGEKLAAELMTDDQVFFVEKAFLRDIGAKISQTMIAGLFKWRR